METTLRNDQKTIGKHTLLTHVLYLLLLLLCPTLTAQQGDICSTLPNARFNFSEINEQPYLNIETLNFPAQSADNPDPLSLSYYIVIESESGDYNNQWGPFTGPSPDIFSTEFGPLLSQESDYKFSIQVNDDNSQDCENKKSFSIDSNWPFSKRADSNDEQLEDWDQIFEYIDNFKFEEALAEMKTKRTFNAEDATLYEFATFDIDRARKEQFEVYFRVYPNPAEDIVFIQNIETKERNLTLVIMDLNGDVKLKREFEVAQYNKVKLNIHKLEPGNYICAIMNKNKRIIGMKHLYKL